MVNYYFQEPSLANVENAILLQLKRRKHKTFSLIHSVMFTIRDLIYHVDGVETHRKLSMQKYLLHYAVVSCPCLSVDLKYALLIVIQDYDNLLVNLDTKHGWRPNSSVLLTRITLCQNIEYGRQWVTSLSLSGQRLSWKLAEQT